MRFKYDRVIYDRDPRRQRSAVLRAQQKERDKAPLFAADIAAMQPTVDEQLDANRKAWWEWQMERRAYLAQNWRRARARIAAIEDDKRRLRIRELWNDAPYPGSPEYLLDMLHSIELGRISLTGNPPWRPTPEEIENGRRCIAAYDALRREKMAVLA